MLKRLQRDNVYETEKNFAKEKYFVKQFTVETFNESPIHLNLRI